MVIGTLFGWGNVATIVLAIVLAFFFGYSLTMMPLLRSGLALATVLPLAFASDTISITITEIVDNLIIVAIPGAMDAGLVDMLFWGSLVFSLVVAFVAAFPVNRYLISRGKGHAVVHEYHHGGHHPWRTPPMEDTTRRQVQRYKGKDRGPRDPGLPVYLRRISQIRNASNPRPTSTGPTRLMTASWLAAPRSKASGSSRRDAPPAPGCPAAVALAAAA